MTDKTDTGESAVGNVVAGEAGVLAAIHQVGTSGAVETAVGVARAVREIGTTLETWQDWLPPGAPEFVDEELIGRDELLTRLEAVGHPLPVRTLQDWEATGLLPRPIMREKRGTGRSKSRARYPLWAPKVIRAAQINKERRLSAKNNAALLRQLAQQGIFTKGSALRENYLAAAFDYSLERIDEMVRERLADVLDEIASAYQLVGTTQPARAELRILDKHGRLLHDHLLTFEDTP